MKVFRAERTIYIISLKLEVTQHDPIFEAVVLIQQKFLRLWTWRTCRGSMWSWWYKRRRRRLWGPKNCCKMIYEFTEDVVVYCGWTSQKNMKWSSTFCFSIYLWTFLCFWTTNVWLQSREKKHMNSLEKSYFAAELAIMIWLEPIDTQWMWTKIVQSHTIQWLDDVKQWQLQ